MYYTTRDKTNICYRYYGTINHYLLICVQAASVYRNDHTLSRTRDGSGEQSSVDGGGNHVAVEIDAEPLQLALNDSFKDGLQ